MTHARTLMYGAPIVTTLAASLLCAQLLAGAQNPSKSTKAPAFEVASVKRSPPIGANGAIMVRLGGLQGNRWTADGVTLLMLIRQAYAPKYQMQGQIVGGPSWLQSDRFIVNAKAEGMPSQEEARLMLQQLLGDRFKLVVRQDMRELPTYALVLARSDGRLGPDLKPLTIDCNAVREAQKQQAGAQQAPIPLNPGDGPPPCMSTMMMSPTSMRLQSGGGTIAELTTFLSQAAGRPVIDRTGLAGYYSVNVEFAREPGAGGPLGGPLLLPPPDAAGGNSTPADVPTIFAAVQERLGFKLEPRRENAEVLVIERAEPPTED